MQLGIWCPAPLSIRPAGPFAPAFEALVQQGGGVDANYRESLAFIKRAEELGFSITLIAQRFLGPDLDSWILSTAIAAHTNTIEIMAAVHPGIIDPRVVAKQAASIDRISGGRFCVNIVNGTRPHEFHAFGEWIEIGAARYRRMEEFIQVLKKLWSGAEVSFKGEFYSFENCAVPTRSVRKPYPPIYAASRAEDGMDVVAREADVWFVNPVNDFERYDESLVKVEGEIREMRRKCAALGRTVRIGISACVVQGETDQEALQFASDYKAAAMSDPSLKSAYNGLSAGIIGNAKTVVERLRRWNDMGVDLFMMQFYPLQNGMERFARDVMPDIQLTGR
jgi:FMNH2-dependent dimethyl sulfone monooxygenase